MSITACSLLALSMMWGVAIAQQKLSAGGGDEAALKALEEKWADANLKGDAVALDAILGDRFIFTSSTGRVEGKAEMLSELRSGDVKYQISKVDDIKVVVYGDAAVVNGRWTGRASLFDVFSGPIRLLAPANAVVAGDLFAFIADLSFSYH